MTAYNRLDLLFQQNNGIVKTAQVLEIGIAKSTFYAYAKQRGVEQAAHGVYVSPDACHVPAAPSLCAGRILP